MILDFNLVLPPVDRTTGFTERDRLIELLRDNGYQMITMESGTRVLMEQKAARPKQTPPCNCCCNEDTKGLGIELYCGGCGHAGCGMRRRNGDR